MWKHFTHYSGLKDCAEHLCSARTPGLNTPSGAPGAEDRPEADIPEKSFAPLARQLSSLQRAGPWRESNAEPGTGMPGGTVAFPQLYLALMPGFQDARLAGIRQAISRTEASTWTAAALTRRSRHMPWSDSMIFFSGSMQQLGYVGFIHIYSLLT